jgi:hypothetical protein
MRHSATPTPDRAEGDAIKSGSLSFSASNPPCQDVIARGAYARLAIGAMRRWVGRHRALGAALAVCLVLVGGALIAVGLGSSTTAGSSPHDVGSVTQTVGSPPSQSDGSPNGGYAGGEASSSITPLGLITALTGLVSALAGLLAAWVALRTSLRTSALAQPPDGGGKAAT